MKRLLVLTVLAAALCSVSLAAETVSSNIPAEPRCATGGFWVMKDGFSAGFGEWSFPLYAGKDGFFIRNCINVGGFSCLAAGSTDEIGGCILGNRIQLGGTYDCSGVVIRTYSILGAGMGLFSGTGKNISDAPYITSWMIGGGFEIQYSPCNAFCIEFGGDDTGFMGENCHNWSDYTTMSPILILGFRSYH